MPAGVQSPGLFQSPAAVPPDHVRVVCASAARKSGRIVRARSAVATSGFVPPWPRGTSPSQQRNSMPASATAVTDGHEVPASAHTFVPPAAGTPPTFTEPPDTASICKRSCRFVQSQVNFRGLSSVTKTDRPDGLVTAAPVARSSRM